MISRRNFFIIIIIMSTILFLFQFSQIVKDYGNDYTYNPYVDVKPVTRNEWKQVRLTKDSDFSERTDKDYILFIGDEDTNIGSIVSQWTLYSKRDYMTLSDINDFNKDSYTYPEFLLVDSAFTDYEKDTEIYTDLVSEGVSIVFLNLPDVETIESVPGLKELFGISYVQEKEVEVEGVKLFSGFLIGGETLYKPKKQEEEKRQDMNLNVPWYITGGGTKTYMVGLMDEYYDDYEYKNDYFPALIWRNSFGNAQVFCVNGDYVADTAGLGILSSMIYELSTYQLYPVVNAQNTLVVDFPLMANENDEEFYSIYSRSVIPFETDVVWPTLVTLSEKDHLKYTCLMAPKYDYSDPTDANFDYYDTFLRLFGEKESEIGISLEHAPGITLSDKLDYDKDYYDTIERKYPPTAAFLDLNDVDELEAALKKDYISRVRTIACDADIKLPILSYITDNITLQSLTSNTKDFTYSQDLMLKSIETVLGYDNAKLTMSSVAWPESDADHWENIYNDMASSLQTYWKPFRAFDRTTLSESDARVRTFLNLYSKSERSGNTINLSVSGANGEKCWFILRTHGEVISKLSGATYKEIEENAYLLEITEENVVIELKAANALN